MAELGPGSVRPRRRRTEGASSPSESPGRTVVVGRALAGVLLALLGSLTLFGLVLMTNAPAYEKLMFALGLGLTGLISAAAQVAVLYGLWLLWTAVHRR